MIVFEGKHLSLIKVETFRTRQCQCFILWKG